MTTNPELNAALQDRSDEEDLDIMLDELISQQTDERQAEYSDESFDFDGDSEDDALLDFKAQDNKERAMLLRYRLNCMIEQKKSHQPLSFSSDPNAFEPIKGDWRDYVDKHDDLFYETVDTGTFSVERALPIPPCTIFRPVDNASRLLRNMVGIKKMKRHIEMLVSMGVYNKMLQKIGGQSHELTLHSVFTGNPGTGKTTLASLLGSLLKDAGILSRGHVVACNRASFCSGSRWGDEEKAVLQILRIAQGGVLFIDEAYSLVSPHPNDPGRQVLPNLLTALSDEKMRDICVVLAGYPKEMEQFLKTNPGIDSRFPNRFKFADYSIDELMVIAQARLKSFGYQLTPSARKALRFALTSQLGSCNKLTWGNAREVVNLLEKVYMLHANRIIETHNSNMLQLTCQDIPAPEMLSHQKQRTPSAKIGF